MEWVFQATLRDSWLNDMITVLSDQNFGSSTSQVEAALKKHEAICAEIDTRVRHLAATYFHSACFEMSRD